MRTSNSAKNLAASISISVLTIFLGFFTRKVFVDEVGVEYLGLNGLLSNILGVMTLLEGGFAASVVYNLYKPLADDDRPAILALLQLYRKVYRYIAVGVCAFGLAIYPFLKYFIADISQLDYVGVVYIIFLFNSLIQYFTAYKWALINTSQKNYKLVSINMVYQVGLSVAKILILVYTKNYILYLVVESVFGILLNVAMVMKCNRMFPYVVNAPRYTVDKSVKQKIITNMKALFLHSLGGYFMHSTDNIVISAYIGVGIIGLYSNYTLLISTVKSFASQALSSFSESVGHLLASESSDYAYKVFKTIFFVNFVVISVPVVVTATSIQPFITFWLGEQYRLSTVTLAVILVNFYVDGMRSSALTFKVKSGIFTQDRFTPLLQGLINLGLSLLLVRFWGLTGVLAATAISIMAIAFWQWPRLIYKHTFHRPVGSYFRKYFGYTMAFLVAMTLSVFVCGLYELESPLLQAMCNAVVSLALTAVTYYLLFARTPEFRSLVEHARMLPIPFLRRKRGGS